MAGTGEAVWDPCTPSTHGLDVEPRHRSSRRSRRPVHPRPLRLECLEDRMLLSIASSGVDESFRSFTAVAVPVEIRAADSAACSPGLVSVSEAVLSGTGESGLTSPSPPAGISELPADSAAAVPGSENSTDPNATVLGAAAKPNLTPYKPADWSSKIVVSNVTGTHANTATLAYTDTLYVDWAAVNKGTVAANERFYIELYVDGTIRNTWYLDELGANTYTSVSDYEIGQLSPGRHTVQIKLDTTKAISESRESDNVYTKTITVTKPNLKAYKPKGWSGSIVVSNVAATSTNSSKLASNETLYVDWAGINSGKVPAAAAFSIQLFVDGSLKGTWNQSTSLDPNNYMFATDFEIGQLAAGRHTIQVKLDSGNEVLETSERDNVFTKTITVKAPVIKPNLTPYQPAGWSDRIVVSTVAGTSTDAASLTTNDTVYIDWAVENNGNGATSAQFISRLYVDGTLRYSWSTDPPLDPGYYTGVTDYSLGQLSAGTHKIEIRTDAAKKIAEISESDNVYSRTVHVTAVLPNLTPYQPAGWSDEIVVSAVTGTNTDASSLTTNDYLYVDWAVLNNGSAATSAQFISQLYVDGKLRNSWHTDPPLNAGYWTSGTDYGIGQLSAGQHTIQIRIDTGKAVAETNESDNVYTKTISVGAAPNYVRFAANYLDAAGEGFYDSTLGAQRRAAFEYALGIWSSLLPRSYVGETITVDVYFDPLGGSAFGAELAHAGPNQVHWDFSGGVASTVYGDALANHLHKGDLVTGRSEIVATFNSDVDNPTVLGSRSWYYGTDGNCGSDSDFVSVVLHEMGHGLDFLSQYYSWDGGYYNGYPGIYDRFLELSGGADMTAMSNADRKAAAVSNNLYWSGASGISGNGGVRPKIYAPSSIEPGSSLSHTDETLYKYDLMSPMYSGPNHDPGSIDLGMLADMGWSVASGSSLGAAFLAAGDDAAGLGEAAPFRQWTEIRVDFPQTLESMPPLGLVTQSSALDFAAGLAAVRNPLDAVDRVLLSLEGTVAEDRSSPDWAPGRGPFGSKEARASESDRGLATVPYVATPSVRESTRITFSRNEALIDEALASGPLCSVWNVLERGLPDLDLRS